MAAANGHNMDQYPEELQKSLSRLGIPCNYPTAPLFTIFPSPGKGTGIKSVPYIPHGTPILSESAHLSVMNNRALSPNLQNDNLFIALSCPTPVTIENRFIVNSFEMGRNRRGIFLNASRFNHSCRPNAYFAWNSQSKQLTVHAILDIPADTEIFVNYLPKEYLNTTLTRQKALRGTYKFTCICDACQSNNGFDVGSRARRRQMKLLDARIKLNQVVNRADQHQNQPQLRNQVLADITAFKLLLELEGLKYPQLADIYDDEVLWYRIEMFLLAAGAQSGRYESEQPKESLRRGALQAAREKLLLDVTCNGHQSPEVTKTLTLIDDVKNT